MPYAIVAAREQLIARLPSQSAVSRSFTEWGGYALVAYQAWSSCLLALRAHQ